MKKPYKLPAVKIVSLEEKDVITTSEVEVDPNDVVDYESKSPRRSMWDNNWYPLLISILHPRFVKSPETIAERLPKISISGCFSLWCHKFIVILHRENERIVPEADQRN